MNFKKIIASVAAAAVAVSAMAVSAFAANFTCSDPYAPDAYLRLVNEPAKEETEGIGVFTQAGLDPTTVYGFKITLVGDVNQGAGGCGFNSQSTGWKSMEWGNEAAGKELSVAADNTITYLSDKPVFAATDTYCHIWIQSWWANVDVEVTSIQPLDKDGNAIDYASLIAAKAAAAEEAAPADEDTAAAEEAAPADEDTAAATDDSAAIDDADEAADEAAADDADDIATDDADDVATDDADDVDVDADEADDADDVATDDADDADAAADEADVADTTADAPAADADTTASSTGNTSAAVILSVMAVAGVAAIVAKKRK